MLDEDFLPSTDTSWGGFNLVGGTTYYWRLRSALGSCGSSGWSQIWKFTTTGACAVPDVPELSSPTNGATGQSTTPLLDWTSESGADSYDVEVCENSSCSSSVTGIVNVPGSSWEVTPALTEGETYYWRARSRDTTCGPSAWTGTWSFTVEDISCPVPDVPELSSPANGATVPTTTPLLDWTSESGADSYDVEVCENSSCSSSVTGIVNVPGSSWEVTPALTEGETYYWRARSRDTTCGPSAWTGTRSFTVSCTEPGVPSLISPVNNAPDVSQTPLLNWSDVAGASTYNVRVCNDSNCSGIIRLENDLTESQWMVTPELTEGAVAWWQAQAVNACDASDWSTAWTFTVCTPPGSPTQLSPANGSMFVSPTPTLDWTDASGATSYTVELCADSACTTVLNSATVASSQWNITSPLDLGMHYWWRVSANTGCGSSPWLGTWDFITSLAPRVMDFNNDMMPDILWQHQERSDIYIWYMDGLLAIGGASLGTVTDPDWQIVNADDFGSADILWQHLTRGDLSLWMMDGINIIGEDDIGRVSDPDWRIVSTEDFDGDGNLDFLWQHQVRADIYIWFMDDNVDWLDSLSLGTVSDKSWKIAGTGDFDGDFKPDILWHHAVRGDVYLWFMDGVTFLDGKHIGTVADTNWQIKATDDYNGDLKPDILWQNVVTGEISAWLMDNDEILAITDVATLSDPDWMIVAPK